MSSSVSEAPRRLPVSCENCRRRKIRCISTAHHAPCETCCRRGYASSCRFKRESPPSPSSEPAASNVELEKQISSLHALLRQNIEATTTLLHQQQAAAAALPSPAPSSHESTAFEPAPSVQTGRLLTSPSNHVRYVPFQGVGDDCLLGAIQDPGRGLSAGFPFTMEQDMAGSRELLDLLPPTRQCDELIKAFFSVISPLFHILHDPTFHSKYRLFRNDPRSAPPSFLALLFVLLALAVTTLDDESPILTDLGHESSPSANIRTLAARYRSAAMRCLVADNFMWRHNLCTMQCLVLLIYAINHAQGSAWSLLGTALHIAVAIGCSVDPAHLDVDPIEAEERRRCWAALKMLYTIQNAFLGNIAPFKLEADVALPADVDDEELLVMHEVPPGHPQSSDGLPTKMSYILYKFRLYNLAFDICRLSASAQLPDRTMVDRLDAKLAVEQQSHLTRFADIQALPVYHVAHFLILSNYTSHLSLLLHRPYLTLSEIQPLVQTPTYILNSLERCEHSALKILSNFESFHTNIDFKPYRWYLYGLGSFHAFLAITSLAVILSKGTAPPATKTMMTKAISNCVRMMQETAARSEVCSKTLSILEPIIEGLPRGRDEQVAILQQPPESNTATTLLPSELDAMAWDSWGSVPQLESLLQTIPCEQWLMPSGFPWEYKL